MKKPLKIVLGSLGAVIIAAGTVATIVLPTTYDLDKEYIKANENYNVKLVDGTKYTTVAKYDATGNITDENFKVLAFTDMHLDTYKECGNYAFNLMIRNIVNEKPDLVVLQGDCITSAFNGRRARQLARTFEKLGVYWTYTLGNHEHDNKWSITRPQMMKTFASYKHCLVDTSKKYVDDKLVEGNNNYVVNILGSGNKIAQSLYFIDTWQDMTDEDIAKYKNVEFTSGAEEYDYIKESQIQWYANTVADVNTINGSTVKSTMFLHIPLKEFKFGYQEITGEPNTDDVYPFNEYTYPLIKDDDNQLLYGKRRETVACSGHNSGMFAKIKELGSTQAVFAGHDHVNDYLMKYQGIYLGYTQPSGYSSYNVISKKVVNPATGEKESIGDKLIQGFSVYTFANDGTISCESKKNSDLYPEMQEDILKVVRH